MDVTLRAVALTLIILVLTCVGCATPPLISEPETVYARCNLKLLDGEKITWSNLQAPPEIIPVGTMLLVSGGPRYWTVTDPATDETWALNAGANGRPFLDKFVSEQKDDLARFSPEIRKLIRGNQVRPGMTREEVYISLGPPKYSSRVRTYRMEYKFIMFGFTWVWPYAHTGKKLVVEFDRETGRVTSTRGFPSESSE